MEKGVKMKLHEFKSSLNKSAPPEGLNDLLLAMWYDAKGDWAKAHNVTQRANSIEAAWVHAYLHRKEGDDSNARYWYSRAHKGFATNTFAEEWDEITTWLLGMTESRIV